MPLIIPGPHRDPIPATDADAALFFTQFAGAWVPATFNVVVPLAATLVTQAAAFATSLLLATDPTTRTAVTIAAKDLARGNLTILIRSAIRAAQAAFLAGLVDEAAVNNLGVRANSLIRTPIGAPVYAPILGFDGAFTGLVRLRLTQVDQSTGLAVTTRGFVYGVVGVQIERKIALADFVFRFTAKRAKLVDSTNLVTPGSLLSYRSRYVTSRGLVSPWSAVAVGMSQ